MQISRTNKEILCTRFYTTMISKGMQLGQALIQTISKRLYNYAPSKSLVCRMRFLSMKLTNKTSLGSIIKIDTKNLTTLIFPAVAKMMSKTAGNSISIQVSRSFSKNYAHLVQINKKSRNQIIKHLIFTQQRVDRVQNNSLRNLFPRACLLKKFQLIDAQ